MSYNYYNPYQENYQWWNPFSCEKEKKSLNDLQKSYNELNQNYDKDKVELSRLRGRTCPTVTCPPQKVCSLPVTCPPQKVCPLPVTCPPQVTCDSYIKSLSDLQSSYQGLQSSYQGLQSSCDSKYKDLQSSCERQYTDYQAELANLRTMTSSCEQDRNSLNSLKTSYQNLQKSCDSQYNNYQTELANLRKMSEQDRNSLNSLKLNYEKLEKEYQNLQSSYQTQVPQNLPSSYQTQVPQNLIFDKNVKYKITKTNGGWDVYEPYRPTEQELIILVNDLFKDPTQTTKKINELENSLGGRGTIPNDIKEKTQENQASILKILKGKYYGCFDGILCNDVRDYNQATSDMYKTISSFYNKIGSLGIDDIKLLTENGRFQKVELNLKFDTPNCNGGSAKITAIDDATNTIDYECIYNSYNRGTLLYGPYKLNPAYTQIFDEVKAYAIRKQEQQVLKYKNLDKDIKDLNKQIEYLKSGYSSRIQTGSYSCQIVNPGINKTDCQIKDEIQTLDNILTIKKNSYQNMSSIRYNKIFNEYSRDNILIDIINDSKGNLDHIKSIIDRYTNQEEYRNNIYNYDEKQTVDTSNIKYISILGRQFQFDPFPDQYTGKTLQELQIGDSFTIIDK